MESLNSLLTSFVGRGSSETFPALKVAFKSVAIVGFWSFDLVIGGSGLGILFLFRNQHL